MLFQTTKQYTWVYASEHNSKVISMTKKCRKICSYKTTIESDDDKRRYKKFIQFLV